MSDPTTERDGVGTAPQQGITRRRALQSLVTLMCAAGVPHWAFTASATGAPAFFTSEEMTFISALADTLIPQTDTAGATEAGVPVAFDELMMGWASGKRRAATKLAIAALRADLNRRAGGSFLSMSAARRLKALTALDAEAYGLGLERYEDYRDIKALLVQLYYASKPGATIELRYDPVPGGYDGDVRFADIGRTWAT